MAERRRKPWQLPAGMLAVLLLLLLLVPMVQHLAQGVASLASPPTSSAEPPPPIILPTQTDITDAPESVHKGAPFTVAGRVVAQGTERGVGHVPVRLWLNVTKDTPGTLLAESETDADGRFAIEAYVNTSASDYQLVAESRGVPIDALRAYGPSWSDPEVSVVADTHLTLELPERAGMLAAVPARGVLTDELGDPVPGASVTLLQDGAPLAQASTDGDGAYEAALRFDAPGTFAVTARFEGDGNNLPSEAQATLVVTDAALDLPSRLDAVRGEGLTINGTLLVGGVPLPDANVTLFYGVPTLLDEAAVASSTPAQVRFATTDAQGAFADHVVVGQDATLGPATVQVSVAERGAGQDIALRVLQRPHVALLVPDAANTTAAVTVLVLDDHDQPVTGAHVVLVAGEQGKLLAGYDLTSDAQGRASAAVNLSHAGDVLLGAQVTGPTLAPTLASKTLHFAGPPLHPLVPLALLGLAGVGALAWLLRPRPLGPAVAVRIGFPALEPGVPAAWQPGEEVRIALRCTRPDGAPLAGLGASLHLGDEVVTLTTDAQGGAEVRRAFPDEAELDIVARTERVEGLRAGEEHAALRIVDYRKEAGRAYEQLVLQARARGARVGRAPSPRELQHALEPLLPGVDLEAFTRTFERATYSLGTFDRAAFVRFVQEQGTLARSLEPAPARLPGGEPAAPA